MVLIFAYGKNRDHFCCYAFERSCRQQLSADWKNTGLNNIHF